MNPQKRDEKPQSTQENSDKEKNTEEKSFDPQWIISSIEKNEGTYKVSSSNEEDTPMDTLTNEVTHKIINNFAEKHSITYNQAMVVITKLVQNGGTVSSKPVLVVKVEDKTYDINDLRTIVKLHDKKGTVRKLAKSMRDIINKIAVINSWPGPLYKDLQRSSLKEGISSSEAPYCSEWNSDNRNLDMPSKIREALLIREAQIKTNLSKKIQKPKNQNKPQKRGSK